MLIFPRTRLAQLMSDIQWDFFQQGCLFCLQDEGLAFQCMALVKPAIVLQKNVLLL